MCTPNAARQFFLGISSRAQLARSHIVRLIRRQRKLRALQWQDVTSYADLLAEQRASILWLHEPSIVAPRGRLLFAELANEEVRKDHFRSQPEPTGVGLACMSDVLVSSKSLVGTSRFIYQLGPVAPRYVDEFLSENHPEIVDLTLSRKRKRFVPGLSVLLTHWNSGIYGHWLLEGMPKLLLLRAIADRLPPFRIVLPRASPAWLSNWVTLILPQAPIEIYDDLSEYVHCEKLLSPTLLMHPQHFFHPELESLLDELRGLVPATEVRHENIYISRSVPSHFRNLINAAEIEEISRQEGFTVIRPETMPIADQISLFASATVVVGEFGSALHNTLFSPPDTKVLCLNWINPLQSRIAHLKRQHVGYLLSSEGMPIKYVHGASRVSYRIDPKCSERACGH